ncbi:amidophosphoribosyltransferase [Solemya pervernicosa gill symbiont]|uniref:Amidophosphoribosyltransferase n=2 Tax=Gammaproteobacteria incertae sedis TaxID=118884 RepID=A0A1T2L7A5_9GAMM|nr:amidophosphoribosyltransferase [Candidatus Reidiella endopervernicosa]OOZ40826.1 amidophosphoribosyltransferase [Solemya pervernicosa gill symbiont]QKQ26337.1 amidophosphoribosyltransferase [Candidatus Reidiella endopervernicosa]
MCGIVGVVATSPVNQALYDGLTVLQHRGQDAAGIMTSDNGQLFLRKDNGLVKDVFRTRHMLQLKGNMGIGHVRYPTAGCSSSAESQPFYVNSPYGISLAHNGNLTNADTLKEDLFREDLRHINTSSDSEVLLNVFAHELHRQNKLRIDENDVFEAVRGVHRRCKGAYAALAMVTGYGIVAFRDPNGIRPLVIGKREGEMGVTEYMFASESVALDVIGFELMRDVEPGEAVYVSVDGKLHSQQCADNPVHSPCIFEFVYFARPDTIIDGISVYKARLRMGETLAQKIKRDFPDHDIDVVIPIPDTSRTSAVQLSAELGTLYREGFIKNRYIGRTFIMPGQTQRKKSVRQKLNAIDLEFRGKNVLLVDDSIVRGTTSLQIIQMARDAGANKVYFASAAPPVRYPNVYGIDMPTSSELIGFGRNDQEIAAEIGADRLFYQDLDDLIESVLYRKNKTVQRFDTSVFNGEYVTGDVTPDYLNQLEASRSDGAKAERDQQQIPIDLHNNS